MPDVLGCAPFTVRMKVGESRVAPVAVERVLRFPFHQDQRLPWRYLAGDRLPELPQRHDPAAVRGDLCGGAPAVREVLVTVGDVEQVQGVHAHTTTRYAAV